jgi:hypothetical protein
VKAIIDCEGKVIMNCEGKVIIDCDGKVIIESDGKVSINYEGTYTNVSINNIRVVTVRKRFNSGGFSLISLFMPFYSSVITFLFTSILLEL